MKDKRNVATTEISLILGTIKTGRLLAVHPGSLRQYRSYLKVSTGRSSPASWFLC